MELKDYGTMLEFSLDRGVYYKDIRGFRFYLRYWKYMIYKIPSLYVTLDREITSEKLKKLEIAANKNACSITGINKKDTLIISLPVEKRNDPKFKELTDDILDRVSLLLMAEKFNPNYTCFFCGKESNEFLPLGEEYLCMHEECFLGYYQKFMEKYDKYQKTKNRNIYLSLLLGVVFAFIGLLPCLISFFASGDYITFLGVFVPLFMIGSLFILKPQVNKLLTYGFLAISLITFIVFVPLTISSIVSSRDITLFAYFFQGSWEGFRKVLFFTLFAFSPLGLIKFYKNLLFDYEESKKLLDEQKINIQLKKEK